MTPKVFRNWKSTRNSENRSRLAKKSDIFYSDRVVEGRLVTRPVLALLAELEGEQVEVCIRKRRNYTSIAQRGYYHGLVIWLLTEELRRLGVNGPHGGPITEEQVHDMMRMKFLREDVCTNPETGEYETIILSTTVISAVRMAEYCEQVRGYAQEHFGLNIPDPDPNWKLGSRA